MIVNFPDRAWRRRMSARLPRRSKNGTPEERAAKATAAPASGEPRKQRRSKNGTPEQRAVKKPLAAILDLAAASLERRIARLEHDAPILRERMQRILELIDLK